MKSGPPRVREYVEALDRFALQDVRPILKRPGASAVVRWPSGAELRVAVEADALDIAYHPALADGSTPPIRDRAALEHLSKPFGGRETYVRCPACSARARLLYVVARRLRCRGCCGHTYRACSSAPEHRLLWKHLRLRERISPDARHLPPGSVPARPRGQYRRVYARLAQEAAAAWQARNALLLPRLGAAVAELRKRYGLDE